MLDVPILHGHWRKYSCSQNEGMSTYPNMIHTSSLKLGLFLSQPDVKQYLCLDGQEIPATDHASASFTPDNLSTSDTTLTVALPLEKATKPNQ